MAKKHGTSKVTSRSKGTARRTETRKSRPKSKTTSPAARARRSAGASATTKKRAKFIARVWSDPGFKAHFLSNPEEALRTEGFEVPEGVQVKVVEDTPDTYHVVIPYTRTVGKIEKLYELMGRGCGCAHCHRKGPHNR